MFLGLHEQNIVFLSQELSLAEPTVLQEMSTPYTTYMVQICHTEVFF